MSVLLLCVMKFYENVLCPLISGVGSISVSGGIRCFPDEEGSAQPACVNQNLEAATRNQVSPGFGQFSFQ